MMKHFILGYKNAAEEHIWELNPNCVMGVGRTAGAILDIARAHVMGNCINLGEAKWR